MKQKKKMTSTGFLLLITIVLFFVMYAAGMVIFADKGFAKPQMFLNLFVSNAGLLVISCGLTIVMITGGIDISLARNANTSTAHMVKSLFLRIILTSPVQFSCQSIKAPDHSQCYNDHDQRDHRSTGPVTDGHGTLIDQGRHYHVGVASQ